ncbi:MAG: hypothetical protein AAGD33_10245 [Actinomycetota bacterium]
MSDDTHPTGEERDIVVHVPARAALAGNPSDGYGGAVVAVPIPELAATVRLTASERFEIGDEPTTFDTLDALISTVDRRGFGDEIPSLVLAAIRSVVRLTDVRPAPCRIDVSTTIPRSVGLAGSSAVVVGVIEALARSASIDGRAQVTPLHSRRAVAVVAHAAEVEELGIAAGLQDRLVQSHREPVLMDFDIATTDTVLGRRCGRTTPLAPVPGDLVVGWRATASAASGTVHGSLRSRADDEDVLLAMSDLGRVGRSAADAIDRRDLDDLARAMDRTFDVRRSLIDLDPSHVEMIEAVRAAGGHANYTGSGGAVVALGPLGTADRWRSALTELTGVDALTIETPTMRHPA